MLRTLARTVLGVAAPPTPAPSRAGSAAPARDRYAIPVHDDSRPRSRIIEAPWGESAELLRFAVVTTEPFPPEWWRRPRTDPPRESPFLDDQDRRPLATATRLPDQASSAPAGASAPAAAPSSLAAEGTSGVASAAPSTASASPAPELAVRAPATPQAERSGAPTLAHADEPRERRRLFARICLILAGAIISFIVVDAASGHGRDT